jgi:hypothetical protein
MKSSRNPRAERPQPTSPELIDSLLALIQSKFYHGAGISFLKDRPRLLKWVVLYPATWLKARAVSLPADRYKSILTEILIDAATFCEPTKVTYLPAYLRQVVTSHFQVHGDEYYDEAKSIRNQVESVMLLTAMAGRTPAPDPVRELAQAASLLKVKKPSRKPAVKDQLTLL